MIQKQAVWALFVLLDRIIVYTGCWICFVVFKGEKNLSFFYIIILCYCILFTVSLTFLGWLSLAFECKPAVGKLTDLADLTDWLMGGNYNMSSHWISYYKQTNDEWLPEVAWANEAWSDLT